MGPGHERLTIRWLSVTQPQTISFPFPRLGPRTRLLYNCAPNFISCNETLHSVSEGYIQCSEPSMASWDWRCITLQADLLHPKWVHVESLRSSGEGQQIDLTCYRTLAIVIQLDRTQRRVDVITWVMWFAKISSYMVNCMALERQGHKKASKKRCQVSSQLHSTHGSLETWVSRCLRIMEIQSLTSWLNEGMPSAFWI